MFDVFSLGLEQDRITRITFLLSQSSLRLLNVFGKVLLPRVIAVRILIEPPSNQLTNADPLRIQDPTPAVCAEDEVTVVWRITEQYNRVCSRASSSEHP